MEHDVISKKVVPLQAMMRITRNILMALCALWFLWGCGADKGERLQQLEMLEQMNRADSVMSNDSLAEDLVAYFDKHGTPNERMRARYMLGRTYFDLGELPRALETYLEAADCADTTASDCDYKILSRVFANMGDIYQRQIQPQSQLESLEKAEQCAKIAGDTIMAIECYGRRANAYGLMNVDDSVIIIKEETSRLYKEAGNMKMSSLQLFMTITPLIKKGEITQAKQNLDLYEKNSGVFDDEGIIEKGREIYYYVKGKYYLSVNNLDSAEYLFRRELSKGKDLNNQIAGSKGLQLVYERKGISDSIAKYADRGYILNDSAYLLSEMQNIQNVQASYNYNHHRQIAIKKTIEAEKANRRLLMAVSVVVILVLLFILGYLNIRRKNELRHQDYLRNIDELSRAQMELMTLHEKLDSTSEIISRKNELIEELQDKISLYLREKEKNNHYRKEFLIKESDIVKHLSELINENPSQKASSGDFHMLRNLINECIPAFYTTLNRNSVLSEIEYEVCLLIRVGFSPSDICRLTGISDGYVSNIRKRLLKKIFCIEDGQPKDFDRLVLNIK